MDLEDKLKNIDQKTLDSAMEVAEKLFGSQMTAKAKENLQNAGDIQELVGKLTKEDISTIEKAISGKGFDMGDLSKKVKDMFGG